ncbi:AAA family ATPase [Kosakonia sp. BYX6]|uniref:AAA family ATPase n=1 Tax=Kosakonia calanthes TaxID=3139408 RepID=A0ABZ3B7A3_9ENTR
MKIAKITLTNFRCFENTEVKLHPRLTILIARNGAGKSTLLDAIALGLGSFLTRLPGVSGLSFKKTDFRIKPDGKQPAYMRIQCESVDGVVWDRTERRDKAKKTLKEIPPGMGLKALNERVDTFINAHNDGEPYTLPVFIYYGTGRGVFDVPMRKRDFKSKFTRFEALDGALESKTNFRRFVQYFYGLEERESRLQKEHRSFDVELPELSAIRLAVKRLMPQFSNIRSVEPAGIMVDWQKNYVALEGDENNPDATNQIKLTPLPESGNVKKTEIHQLKIEQLSDGYRTTLAMVMDIAARLAEANPFSTNPLESEGIILIDEVDLHLHPEWQREFLPRLVDVFPNLQFIVSTHSPFILQSVKEGELIDLDQINANEAPDLGKEMSVEDIAEKWMGMDNVQRSAIFNKQVETASRYYALLNSGKPESDPEVAALSEELDSIEKYFGDNPVYVALLRAERRKKAREAK